MKAFLLFFFVVALGSVPKMKSILRLESSGYSDIFGCAVDMNTDEIYLPAPNLKVIYKLTPPLYTPVIYAGILNSTGPSDGDGGLATSARVPFPAGMHLDNGGNLIFADDCSIRKIDKTTRIITTLAGKPFCNSSYVGEGGLATNAILGDPFDVTVDNGGNLYIGDWQGLRFVNKSTGIITTIYNESLCESAALNPINQDVYLATFISHQIIHYDPDTKRWEAIVGRKDIAGYTVDGTVNTNTMLNAPYYLRFIPGTQILTFTETGTNFVRKIDLTTMKMTTIAGTGVRNPHSDGPEDPTKMALHVPWGVCPGPYQDFVITESNGNDWEEHPDPIHAYHLYQYTAPPSSGSVLIPSLILLICLLV